MSSKPNQQFHLISFHYSEHTSSLIIQLSKKSEISRQAQAEKPDLMRRRTHSIVWAVRLLAGQPATLSPGILPTEDALSPANKLRGMSDERYHKTTDQHHLLFTHTVTSCFDFIQVGTERLRTGRSSFCTSKSWEINQLKPDACLKIKQ